MLVLVLELALVLVVVLVLALHGFVEPRVVALITVVQRHVPARALTPSAVPTRLGSGLQWRGGGGASQWLGGRSGAGVRLCWLSM